MGSDGPEQGLLKHEAQGRVVLNNLMSYRYLAFKNIRRP